jgi:hypothetical protein
MKKARKSQHRVTELGSLAKHAVESAKQRRAVVIDTDKLEEATGGIGGGLGGVLEGYVRNNDTL